MNSLYIDIGNSSVKMIVNSSGRWEEPEKIRHSDMEALARRINRDYQGYDIVCCSVRKDLVKILERKTTTRSFNILHVPLVPRRMLNYRSPDTLGMDRFLVCYGASVLSGKGVIVIDSGSACTVDYMTPDRIYQGGVILPGLSLTEQNVKRSLPELPLPEPEIPSGWPGKSTKECLQWGLYGGFKAMIHYFIDLTVQQSNEELQLFICGGDASRIAELLNLEQPVTVDQNLLFKGMDLFNEKFGDSASS